MSRQVFAFKIGVNPRTLERWEQGRSKPNEQASALIRLVRKYPDTLARLVSSEGLCPSDSPTPSLARRCAASRRSGGSLATLARRCLAFDRTLRGREASGTVLPTGREVVRSRGQGAEWVRSPTHRVTVYEIACRVA